MDISQVINAGPLDDQKQADSTGHSGVEGKPFVTLPEAKETALSRTLNAGTIKDASPLVGTTHTQTASGPQIPKEHETFEPKNIHQVQSSAVTVLRVRTL